MAGFNLEGGSKFLVLEIRWGYVLNYYPLENSKDVVFRELYSMYFFKSTEHMDPSSNMVADSLEPKLKNSCSTPGQGRKLLLSTSTSYLRQGMDYSIASFLPADLF